MEIIYANSKIEVFIKKVNKNLGARIEKTIDKNQAYLLHIFMKKEQKIRKSDIEMALRVKKIVLE